MKRWLLPALALICVLTILRESGVVRIFLASTQPDWATSISSSLGTVHVTSVSYMADSGRPFIPEIKEADDTYRCTVTYRITTSLSPWRWIPFFKFGQNQAQLTYIVWAGNAPMGCGAITSEGRLSVAGIASARDYGNIFTEPLIEQMKRAVGPKLAIFTREKRPTTTSQ